MVGAWRPPWARGRVNFWGGGGFLRAPARGGAGAAACGGGVLLVMALPITDEAGFALGAAVVAAHWWRTRGVREPAAG